MTNHRLNSSSRRLCTVLVACLAGCGPEGNSNVARTPPDADNGVDMRQAMPDMGTANGENSIASIVIEPSVPEVVVDTTLSLTATAYDGEGDEVTAAFTWSSSAPEIAEVAASGIVIGAAVGTASVTATTQGVSETVEVRVLPTPAAEMIVSPTEREMFVGDTVQISVELLDANGGLLDASEREISFEAQNPNVVSVSDTGLVTAVSAGDTDVVITADGLEATSSFTVTDSELERIDVTPTAVRLYPGDTAQLDVSFTWVDLPGTSPTVTWSSSDESVATVTDGTVTAVAKGDTIITAEADGRSAMVDVEVAFDFGEVSAGGAHACGLVDNVAWCWGDNTSGQLGHASADPSPVATTLRFRQISAGGQHTCAIATDDKLHCWGANGFGQLGDGSTQPDGSPVQVGSFDFASVSAGSDHTCAVTLSDQAYCWGNGADGRLGTGGTADQSSPVLIGSYTGIVAGDRHTCATNNGVGGDCWGDNDSGQLGRNISSDFEASPGAITGGYDFSAVVVGESHTCGVTTANSAACWGLNDTGQVGDGGNVTRVTPILLPGSPQLTRLTVGASHSCGLSATGAAYCWGEGDGGRLGTGNTSDQTSTTGVAGNLQFSSLSGGSDFTCGVTLDGDVHCWGVGYGTTPVAVFP